MELELKKLSLIVGNVINKFTKKKNVYSFYKKLSIHFTKKRLQSNPRFNGPRFNGFLFQRIFGFTP